MEGGRTLKGKTFQYESKKGKGDATDSDALAIRQSHSQKYSAKLGRRQPKRDASGRTRQTNITKRRGERTTRSVRLERRALRSRG